MATFNNANFEEQENLFGGRPRCPTFVTERLTLRLLRTSDGEFLAALNSDPNVMQFVHRGPLTKEQARDFAACQVQLASYHRFFTKWLVERREDQARLGWVEITKFEQGHKRKDWNDDLQIGYQFAPAFWHAGYATEASRVVVEYSLQKLNLDRLVAFARPDNRGSVRVLEKLGFTQDGYCQDDGGYQCAFYVLTREAWQAQKRS